VDRFVRGQVYQVCTDAELRAGTGRRCRSEAVLVLSGGRRRQDAAGPGTADVRAPSAAGPRCHSDVVGDEWNYGSVAAETSDRYIVVY